jgi:putative ABC transport system ATP-binding protein
MFTIENLSKVYTSQHGTVRALDNISLTVEQGSFVAVTGGSGSGKTTLLLTLGGLIRPTVGTVAFSGTPMYTMSEPELAEYRNRKVGFVLQTFNLIPYLTAIENVMLPMIFNSNRNGTSESSAAKLLDKVGLKDRTEHLPRELSVGQQQRVAIARALANSPDVILADEPTGNLDPNLSLEVLRILKELNEKEGRTVIMVTHSPEAARFGNRQLHLKDGRIVDRLN